MSTHSNNTFPKLHNAMWPGLVGKGPDSEPPIDLDTMLDLTAKAEVDGIKFDGVDLFLFDPHVSIDISEDELKKVADKITAKGFVVGSVVAPVWPPTGGGSAMGGAEDRQKFVEQVRKACRIAQKLREWGVRPYGIIRIDSASSPSEWLKDPKASQKLIAQTFSDACDVAEDFGERLAAEGEVCWGGMHSWKHMVDLLERVGRPETLGFQADMAHTLLYTLGINAPEDRILPANFDWKDRKAFDKGLQKLTAALRPWTIDFHVAQNDATVKGSGSHDKTGRHCLATDPNGKLDIPHHAGFWLRDEKGKPTKAFQHICWDGCMFPNDVMMQQETWNNILAAMIAVRDEHGWSGGGKAGRKKESAPVSIRSKSKPAAKKAAKKAPAKAPTKKVATVKKAIVAKKKTAKGSAAKKAPAKAVKKSAAKPAPKKAAKKNVKTAAKAKVKAPVKKAPAKKKGRK